MTRFAWVAHVVVPSSRHRTCARPAWTSAAASASESLDPSASSAVVFMGVVVVGLMLLTLVSVIGEPNAVRPYCAAIGTSTVPAPSALIDRLNDPTVVL